MGDLDTDDGDKKGVGALGAAGTAAGAYLGATAASQFVAKPADLPQQLAKKREELVKAQGTHEEKVAALLGDPEKGAESTKIHDTYQAAKSAHATAEAERTNALNSAWNKAIEEAKPEEMSKMRLANLEAQVKVIEGKGLEKTTLTAPQKELAAKGVKAQIEAVKKVTGGEGFKALSSDKAHAAIEEALAKGWADAVPAADRVAVETAMAGFVHKDTKVFEAMTKAADNKVVEAVAKAAPLEPVENLAKAAAEAEKPWKALEATLESSKPLAEATKEVEKLSKLEALNAEKGLSRLSRPIKILSHTGTGGKLAILGGAVALGGATYAGIKSYRNRDAAKEADTSFTERLDQQKAAAATQSAGMGSPG